MTTQLDVFDQKIFEKCEAEIERNLGSFLAVGGALKTIRDRKLYKDSHETFERYCTDRWGFERAHAYRLITAVDVKDSLSPLGDISDVVSTESHLRELGRVEPEIAEVVVDRIRKQGQNTKPTAKQIREVVDEICLQIGDISDENVSPGRQILTQCETVKEKPAHEQAVDNADEVDKFRRMVNDVIRKLKDIPELPGTELIREDRQIVRHLETAKDRIKCCIPGGVCTRCEGQGCPLCRQLGWIDQQTKYEWEKR